MDIIGASFTIILLILILVWPFLAIYVAQRITIPRKRSSFQAYDYNDACSCQNHGPGSTKIYAPTSGEAP